MPKPKKPKPSPAKKKPRSAGRPPLGSEDKRERILSEALELFAVNGFWGTSLNDIAGASDISKAGLLHHFGSKEQLFAEVLERRDAISSAPWKDPGPSPWDLLDSFVSIVETNQTQPALVRLYTSVAAMGVNADNLAHDWLRGHFELAVDSLAGRLEKGKSDGTVKPDAPSEALARLLAAAADGLQVQWLCQTADDPSPESEIDMAEHIGLLVDLIRDRWELTPE